jgi:hypothetical protein
MATLGDLLASARDTGTFSRWLAAADARLAAALAQAVSMTGETPDQFARIAVADFSHTAGDEAWTALITRVREARDPAVACLEEMVRWRLCLGDGAAGVASRPRE